MSEDVPYKYVDCEVELRNVRWHISALTIEHGPKQSSIITWDLLSARWGIGGRQLDQHEIRTVLASLDPGELTSTIERAINS